MSDIREMTEASAAACFPVMQQLRPHLRDASEFAERWRRQQAAGYRVVALWSDGRPQALAGFRVMENLIHGSFLYVDDLVCDAQVRRSGHGARLLSWLQQEARGAGCSKLVLDTALDNALAHRFYFREGLLAKALRFNIELT